MKPAVLGSAKIALSFAVWSTWALFSRNTGLSWEGFVFWLSLFTSALALGVSFVSADGVGKPTLPLLSLGVLLFLNNAAFFYAIEKTSVANALFTHYLAPVLVAALAPLLIGEKPMRRAPLCVAASLLGLYLILPAELSGAGMQGVAAGLFSAGAYAGMVIMVRKFAITTGSLRILFWQNLVVALFSLPLALGASGSLEGRSAALLAVLAAVHSVAVPLIYLSGIRRVTAQTAAILGYIEPLGAVLWAALFLGESLPRTAWAGCLLIIAAGSLAVGEESGGGSEEPA